MIRCLEVFTQRYKEFFDFDCVEMSYTERFTILIFKGKTLGEPCEKLCAFAVKLFTQRYTEFF